MKTSRGRRLRGGFFPVFFFLEAGSSWRPVPGRLFGPERSSFVGSNHRTVSGTAPGTGAAGVSADSEDYEKYYHQSGDGQNDELDTTLP